MSFNIIGKRFLWGLIKIHYNRKSVVSHVGSNVPSTYVGKVVFHKFEKYFCLMPFVRCVLNGWNGKPFVGHCGVRS